MKLDDKERLAYRVGALLYTPAFHAGIAEKMKNRSFPYLTSMAFCLEDSICDEALGKAEAELRKTLFAICESGMEHLPLLFVRIRTPEHLTHVHQFLGDAAKILTGYILPKFDPSNAYAYAETVEKLNRDAGRPIYVMPILESRPLADIETRTAALRSIREVLDSIHKYVLNVRVGGNDFSNLYGLRRGVHQNIYQIGVIRDILMDIINVFAADYVVSGPVWEYFGDDPSAPWADGLRAELALDRLNGFTGKTAIHPCQLPVIYESMQVSQADYDDAMNILGWQPAISGVAKSADGSRMNEVKCHRKWARRIAALAEAYGIRDEQMKTENAGSTQRI